MSAKQNHPYHLVDPSPWPVVGAVSLLILAIGTLVGMHDSFGFGGGKKWLTLLPGLILVLYTMYSWWSDVINEGTKDKAHNEFVRHGLRIGMALFILSEVMFFFAFFFSFFRFSLLPIGFTEGDIWPVITEQWPPAGVETFDPWDVPFLNTLILLLSGTSVTWAHHALLKGDRKGLVQGLAWTVTLGILFTSFQAYEYVHAVFGFTDGVYSSNFYMATGFHGFHVLVGTIFLAVCLVRAMKGQMNPDNHLGFEFAAWYWHFVDVVWIFLFVSIYLWGS